MCWALNRIVQFTLATVLIPQGSCVLKLHPLIRLPLSQRRCALAVVYVSRSEHTVLALYTRTLSCITQSYVAINFLSEMSIWGYHNHQSSQQPWEGHYPSLWYQFIQASPSADPSPRGRTRTCRNEWNWKIYSTQDLGWKVEAKFGEIFCKLLTIIVLCDHSR